MQRRGYADMVREDGVIIIGIDGVEVEDIEVHCGQWSDREGMTWGRGWRGMTCVTAGRRGRLAGKRKDLRSEKKFYH